MGHRGGAVMFGAWCQANSQSVLPDAIFREIAELRFTNGRSAGVVPGVVFLV